MDKPAARPLAMLLGGALGGTVSLVGNAIAPLPAVVLGALLGETSLLLSRAKQAEHRRRVAFIEAYPALRRIVQIRGVTLDDHARVRDVHDAIQRELQAMVDDYRRRCERLDLPHSVVLDNVLKAFFLTHCMESGPLILTSPHEACRYLAAIPRAAQESIKHALKDEKRSPEVVLRERGCYFVKLDLLGNQLRDAASFRVTVKDHEWTVIATTIPDAAPLVDCYLPSSEPIVSVQRVARRAKPPLAPTSPSPSEGGADAAPKRKARHTVTFSAGFSRELDQLSPQSPTRLKLDALIDDLNNGRPPGHTVRLQGQNYFASDALIEGDCDRGRWRVIYQRNADAYEFHGIYDYHEGRHPIRWTP